MDASPSDWSRREAGNRDSTLGITIRRAQKTVQRTSDRSVLYLE